MKGCLKLSPADVHGGCYAPTTLSSTSSTTDAASTPPQSHSWQTHRKFVVFCAAGSETVYTADEWDRTPAEPARKLSFQDCLELEAIKHSLPCANQPPDAITGRPGTHFLSRVPIVLLPLLSSSASPSRRDRSDGANGAEAKNPYHVEGRIDGNGWGRPV